MVTPIDSVLLILIFTTYGIGDVVTTLYGMSRYGLTEGNPIMVTLLGKSFNWYESIAIKSITLFGAFLIYYLARIQQNTRFYQIVWWIIAAAIIFRGLDVSLKNWKDIRARRKSEAKNPE